MCSYRYSVVCCSCCFILCAFCTVSQLITTGHCLAYPTCREILKCHNFCEANLSHDDGNGSWITADAATSLQRCFWSSGQYHIGCGSLCAKAKPKVKLPPYFCSYLIFKSTYIQSSSHLHIELINAD